MVVMGMRVSTSEEANSIWHADGSDNKGVRVVCTAESEPVEIRSLDQFLPVRAYPVPAMLAGHQE